MATKFQRITALYESTIKDITASPSAWKAFLRSACCNYKCRFDEQVLVYAQRPDATAALEIEKWNKRFGRWVNKGATGIAVFDDEHNGGYRLKHYFDIADTHESRAARSVPIWNMKPEYEAEVIECLENSFGALFDKSTLVEAIISAAGNAVEDNITDYLTDLINCREGSTLEQLDEDYLQKEYSFILRRSVAYMMLIRCGIDADEYLADFRPITYFDTSNTVNALGIATSDIAESCLREIASTVLDLQKQEKNQNRTFAKPENIGHNEENEIEGSAKHDRSLDISDGGRLPYTEPDRAGRRAGSPWQIRVNAEKIPPRESASSVYEPADQRQAEYTPDGSGSGSRRADGAIDSADGEGAGRDGADESNRPDEMGGNDEQYPGASGGSSSERTDILLKPLPSVAQQLNLFGEAEEEEQTTTSAFAMPPAPADAEPQIRLDFSIGFSEHPVFYNRENDFAPRYTDISFALANRLLGILDEKQHRERESNERVGWYHKTDFTIKATVNDEEFTHDGRFDIGDGEGDLIAHIQNFFDYALSPEAEHLYQGDKETLQHGRDELLPFLMQHSELTPEDERLFAEIMATENDWFAPVLENAIGTKIIAKYSTGSEITAIVQASNGRFFNHYGYDEKNGSFAASAGAFDTFGDAEKALYSHRPTAKPQTEPVSEVRNLPEMETDLFPDPEQVPDTPEAFANDFAQTMNDYYKEHPAYLESTQMANTSPFFIAHQIKVGHIVVSLNWALNELENDPMYKDTALAYRQRLGELQQQQLQEESAPATHEPPIPEPQAEIVAETLSLPNADKLLSTDGADYYLFHFSEAETPAALSHDTLPLITERAEKYIICADVCYLSAEEMQQHGIEFRKIPRDFGLLPKVVRETIAVIKPEYMEVLQSIQTSPPPVFFVNWEKAQFDFDLSRYNDHDIIGYDKNGVEYAVGKMDRLTYVTQTGAFWGDNAVPGEIYEQLNAYLNGEVTEEQVRENYLQIINPNIPQAMQPAKPIPDEIEGVKLNSIVIDFSPRQPEPEPEPEPEFTPTWVKTKPTTQSFDAFPGLPEAERHNFCITDDNLGSGGPKAKYRNNIEAIKTLQTIEAERRTATPEEQEILSRYVGWGGLADAFDADRPAWAHEYTELKSLLTEEEYAAARASTLNAHYTSPTVIKAIYQAVENMGFTTGNILEPSCGVGNFFGLLPDSMSASKLYGVELDSITGRIARQLYQKHSIAVQGFETTAFPDSFFDVAIGNVPFGNYKVQDKQYDKLKFSIHDYFFAKTLDKVRPGGILAFVTSKFMMDAKNPRVRKYLAQRADLIGAIRLPNNAFKDNAGTEVTSDIIFLQKRDRITDIEPDWVHLGQTEDGIAINSYFAENPEMVLGTMSVDSSTRMYGAEDNSTCLPIQGEDLGEQLREAITNINAHIDEYEHDMDDEQDFEDSLPADPNVRNFSYTLVEDKIYFREDSRMKPAELPVTTQNRVKGLIELRECARTLIEYQTEDYPEADIRSEQVRLNKLYDEFTHKYGVISSRGNNIAFGRDSAYPLLCSLEILDGEGNLERKADMFTKRTIKPHIPITHADTASEALAVSIAEKARVDLAFMSELSGISEEKLVKDLESIIFLNIGSADSQGKTYVTADEYLSGNIREKLVLAQAAAAVMPELAVNVRALEAVIPKDLTAAEISVRLGATWLPEDVVQQFMVELLQTPRYLQDNIHVRYMQLTGEWNISGKNADRSNVHAHNTYGTDRANAYKIIEDSLNLRDVRIFDKVINADGNESRVLNKKQTAIAQAKQELIRSKFEEWIWQDPDRRERLCRIYNDKFNSIRPREYDGAHLIFPGMNPEITLQQHQLNAIAHILYGGNTLLAHVVGAGKTFEMVAAAMESKRLGLCHKSLMVVPNHLTEQWAAEFLQLYPAANILVATKKDFETKNRKKFCARIATGDYDAVIIGHSQFEKIPLSAERQKAMYDEQINELVAGINELKRSNGERFTVKQMEKARKNLEIKLAKLNDRSRKDDVVNFEDLGIDRLFVDEAHSFKNLFLVTKMRNVAGIAQTEAQKSSDLFMKTRYMDEKEGGRGVVFATGTPISNSMTELYTMQRYLQYNQLVRNGLQHFDAWASTFGETVTAIELAPEGSGYRAKTRFAKFFNLPELMSMFKEVADIQTADMLNLPVPKANFHTEVTKPSAWQQEIIASLADRAENIRNKKVDPSVDNMLRITNDGRKLALEQRLIEPMLPDDLQSKVNACTANVFRIWEETKDKFLTQLVFCDLSTPKKKAGMEVDDTFTDVYSDLRAKLIDRGIPAEEIAFIHDADTEVRKKELFAKVRQGKVRVLMGSTQKMGAGTNVQDRLIALHDLDCPWRPSDVGRALRTYIRRIQKRTFQHGS